MEDYPRTISEFRNRFSNEEACLSYLAQFKWPEGFTCLRCDSVEYRQTKRGLYQCRQCGQQISITSGTIFHGTRKPLTMWFEAMWHITSQKYGANALGLQRVLGLGSYHTAWEWLHRLRKAMICPGRKKLAGVVEVDETLIGGKKPGKRGRGAEGKAIVVVMVEDKAKPKKNEIGRIRLVHVPDASGNSLIGAIKDNVLTDSEIHTDGWQSYNGLVSKGYSHKVLDSEDLTICHLVASLLKRWLLGTYQGATRFSHLDYYLDEYTFRFNRRSSASRGKLFYRLVQQCVVTSPLPGNRIVGGKIGNVEKIEF